MPPEIPSPRGPERQKPRTEIRNRRKEAQESPRIRRRDQRTVMADVGSLEKMGRELKCPIWYAAAAAAAALLRQPSLFFLASVLFCFCI